MAQSRVPDSSFERKTEALSLVKTVRNTADAVYGFAGIAALTNPYALLVEAGLVVAKFSTDAVLDWRERAVNNRFREVIRKNVRDNIQPAFKKDGANYVSNSLESYLLSAENLLSSMMDPRLDGDTESQMLYVGTVLGQHQKTLDVLSDQYQMVSRELKNEEGSLQRFANSLNELGTDFKSISAQIGVLGVNLKENRADIEQFAQKISSQLVIQRSSIG